MIIIIIIIIIVIMIIIIIIIIILGRRITMSTSDARETSFLFQRISVTLQRLNAVCVSDTFRDVLVNDSG